VFVIVAVAVVGVVAVLLGVVVDVLVVDVLAVDVLVVDVLVARAVWVDVSRLGERVGTPSVGTRAGGSVTVLQAPPRRTAVSRERLRWQQCVVM
jgi:hypothetical protein